MAIIHVVQFGFKPEVPKEQVDEVCRRVLALKDECINPTTKKPYIKSFIGGIDKSEEGLQGGVTHVFVAEVESKDDLQYYLEKDPVHLAFSKSALPLIQTARVVDFEPGRFSKL
ncbi:stress responsive A/B barrel domain-containing protein [Phyllosticta citribraziliensis]